MMDPRSQPSATPPPVPKDAATGEWSSQTARETPVQSDSPTVTASGQPPPTGDFGIPNPFGRYTILRLLGRGGMGAVFLAHDTQLHRPVALKVPNFSGALTDAQKERFFREARAVAALRHPNICPVHDADEEQGVLYLTTAYIDGHTLSTLIDRGPMPADKAIPLVRNVAEAMQAAHTHGTIHRDLKPANIMIDRAGEPVVMDFGLARRTHWREDSPHTVSSPLSADQGLTQHGSVLGTPAYMPPEQARGDVAAIGPQSDVYSLGVILFELLTGRRPFAADDTSALIEKIVSELPPRLSDFYPWLDAKVEGVCLKAMAKDPADRFATMAEFERALKDAVEPELSIVVPPPLPSRRGKRPRTPHTNWFKRLAWIGLFLTLLMVICVGIPVAGIWILIDRVSDKVNEIQQAHEQSRVEWDAIVGFWPPPPPDASVDVLFPSTIPDGYFRLRHDTDAPDAELGITLAGRRAVYTNAQGEEVEVRVYRCKEAEAKAIQSGVQAFVSSVQNKTTGARGDSKRQKVVYSASDSGHRTVTYGFADSYNQNHEYGKLWYATDWLFYFRTAAHLRIEFFPSKYLMEVGKRANVATPALKK
jgi:serine/threonine protein kinase